MLANKGERQFVHTVAKEKNKIIVPQSQKKQIHEQAAEENRSSVTTGITNLKNVRK
ncbi:MAG: hypothetical protein IJY98_01060 [Bacteroidaceae bacterium]|nr:hypothetical protein [Bacteroidaceae bacterium]